MRDDLNSLAEVVTFSLAFDDMLVDLAGCDVIIACKGNVQVAFVVAEIEVNFSTIGEDENFAMPVQCLATSAGL